MDQSIISEADYVIIGAGSAGCVVAARLSEDPSLRVVLIEAGGSDRKSVISLPVGYARTLGNPKYDWCYSMGPEPGLDNRTIHYARGKILGGSSSINGLAWVRGARADYDNWVDHGCAGWGWDDVLPYLIRSERFAPGGPDRGHAGPVPVDFNPGWYNSMEYLLDSGAGVGLPRLRDYNVAAPLGLARAQLNWEGGQRQSSAATYLRQALRRPNLTVLIEATVEGLLVENGAATGVRVRRGAEIFVVRAHAEVILSAGAIGSPLLLEQSGIGQPERLRALGIQVEAKVPEVGENLRDHLFITSQFRLTGLGSYNAEGRGLRAIANGLRYLLQRKGPLAATPTQILGYGRTAASDGAADIEILASAITYAFAERNGRIQAVVDKDPGMSLSFYQCRPRSSGYVHLADASGKASVVANFLAEQEDRNVVIAGMKLIRRLAAQRPITDHIAEEITPGMAAQTDDDLLAFARQAGGTGFHVVGSCRMGSDDRAVVNLKLQVNAVRRLRIVDASVMPQLVGANTHAPTVMIAERAADFILRREPPGQPLERQTLATPRHAKALDGRRA